MRIAVMGAGLCGLALSYYLLELAKRYKSRPLSLTLFDAQGVGNGASGVAAGLLHPFCGMWAHRHPYAEEAMEIARQLGMVLDQKEHRSPVGLLRLAKEANVAAFYREQSLCFPEDLDYLSEEKVAARYPYIGKRAALWIRSAIAVKMKSYLFQLHERLMEMGIHWEKGQMMTLEPMRGFDATFVCIGSGLMELTHPKLPTVRKVRGEIARIWRRGGWNGLSHPVMSRGYFIPEGEEAIIGGTYERGVVDLRSPKERFEEKLEPLLRELFPQGDKVELVTIEGGYRLVGPNHHPIVGKLERGLYLFSAMGSRGLFYHGWLARRLARAFFEGSAESIPEEYRLGD